MQNPPPAWKPAGWNPTASQQAQRSAKDYTLAEALRIWQWRALWLLLFLNTFSGISINSQEAPMFIELSHVTAIVAAGMAGAVSMGNAIGRVLLA